MNKLFYGDNLDVLRKYIKDDTVDLCYIDPPFNSKRNYNQIYNNIGKEDKAQAQAFVDTWTWDEAAEVGLKEISTNYRGVFSSQSIDLIQGLCKVLNKGPLMSYLVSMTLRIAEIYRVLKPSGSFYFHCDPTASHYLKLVIDSVFCPHGGDFKNEIIWHYSGWNAKLNTSFNSRHDVILFYSKSDKITFNSYSVPWASEAEYIKIRKQKLNVDLDGRKYVMSDAGGGNRVKRYLDEAMGYGKPIDDVWTIDKLNNSAKEALGYPTQKPEVLLERVIEASSKEGDVILDAYCGCGTTISVAERLKRKWIGIDITYQSISLILKRLDDTFGKQVQEKIQLNGVPRDFESAEQLAHKKDDKVRKEFEKWAVLTYSVNRAIINDKKGGDGGIDGISYVLDFDEKKNTENRKVIFSVKSNKVLTPTVVRDLFGTVEREGAAMGFLISLYPVNNLVKESKKYGQYFNSILNKNFQKINVITVEEILNGARMVFPTSQVVLKSAKRNEDNSGQVKMFSND